MKIILIQGLLAPYRYPIFEELGLTPGWQFEVWFMGKDVKNRIWKASNMYGYHFKYRFLQRLILNFSHKDIHPFWINPSILKELAKAKPDVIIMMGWDSLTSFLAHIYCKITGAKFILFADSTQLETSWRRSLTHSLVSWHVKSAGALIAGGSLSQKYLESLGGKKTKTTIAYNTVDVEKYEEQVKVIEPYKHNIKEELGLLDKKIILYYGQLIKRKGIDVLLQAYRELKKTHPHAALLLIGDGPLRPNLEQIIHQQQLQDVVILNNPGDEQIAAYYAIATVFVLPSHEDVWGLVVNEAMAASLPVIVSDQVGCAVDLIEKGINGYIFPSGSSAYLAHKLTLILESKVLQKRMALESHRKIQDFLPRVTAQKFKEAIMSMMSPNVTKLDFAYPAEKNLISIIIPVQKNQEGLKETLVSLKNQENTPPHELIIEHDEDRSGSYQARNTALARSRGEYFAFIDAGTLASPHWLRTGYNALKNAEYVGGPILREPKKLHESWAELFGRYREFPVSEFMHDLHFAPTTNLFIKREIIEALGDFDDTLYSGGDREFGNRVYHSHLFRQKYVAELIVTHPFRTYRELMQKQRRLSQGQRQSHLHALTLFLVPPLWLLTKPSFKERIFQEKCQLFLMTYHLSIIHHITTIRRAPLRVQ